MSKNNREKTILKIAITMAVILLVVVSSGCMLVTEVVPPTTKTIGISGTDYDTAFSKAMRACTDIGYVVYPADKSGGSFYADRSVVVGILGADQLTFLLDKEGKNKLSASITIRSARASEEIDKFIQAYGKYVSISY